ncbi:acyl-[ACP]--phospholipid O-acyltransferase [Methylocystis heyeri]|uniref:Acyl-[ACP]--phospholipid O-acyltransferase n=1 Tax=Methylocystis heyeri TaxID=391905 RepID=A0A6B8KHA8_9HYPH|nr:acyl-[ACP]--phospholipid O-acyltransferase [Methylocystis heyeri]QGM46989.1 acyl-[ACP]--phospholipid O-acyltransferase [Methylocystis heyeri]
MPKPLIATRRFAPLFWCQFFAAFDDNFLKNAVVLFILFKIGGDSGASLVTLAGVTLIAPHFLFSALGGQLADKYDKALVARRLKLAEIAAAAVGAAGFWLGSTEILFLALFLFGLLGALFMPVKYGILPDCLAREELPAGNAMVEGATFLAILTGTIAGGLAMEGGGDNLLIALGMMSFALAAYAAARLIPSTPRADPELRIDKNILRSTAGLLVHLKGQPRLWRLGIVTSIFWLIGAVAMSLLPPLVTQTLHGSSPVVTIHLAAFAIAIAVGSAIAAWLLHGRIALLPAAVGAAIIAVASIDLGLFLALDPPGASEALLPPAQYFAQPAATRALIDLVLLSIAGGLMVVPAFAALQAFCPPQERARVIAAVNVLNAAFMVGGGVIVAAAQAQGAPVWSIFLCVGAMSGLSAWWILEAVVDSPLQDFLYVFFSVFHRLETKGLEHFEAAGSNPIIALNHVSFLDAALALAILPKNPVFAIDRTIATAWWVKPFLRFVRAVPLDPTKPLGTRALVNLVKSGETLVIFPEGRLTVTGSLMKVYDGAALIADKSGAKVVPVRIEGPETTVFSRLNKAQVRRRWLPKFTLTALEPAPLAVDQDLKGRARRQAAGAALYHAMSDLIFRTSDTEQTLFDAVSRAAKEHGHSRIALEDPVSGQLSYRKLLIGARVLAEKLSAYANPGDAVGLLVPNANGAGVALLALSSAGCAPAMINFTAGPASILSGLQSAQAKTVVTSRAFIEKGNLQHLIEALGAEMRIIYLEDLRDGVTLWDKLRGVLLHGRPLVRRRPEDPAAILFTSGSEGTPKGVVLSHRNILANAAQAAARIDFGRSDKVFNVLPIFHSFGLTAGFVLPIVSGVPIYLYPSPLHYRIIPELVYNSNATILFGTDTFLTGYARTANSYDFRSIRYVVAGAEPVKEATRATWGEKFGVRILEGYGVTETAPVLALNTPMFNKFGTVGRLMPGIECRLEPVPGVADGGRLVVRGPNVMLGYLMADNPGVLQPPAEGWHDTGDIVSIDAEGFVAIKGRAKRFAKIGGEMVSLAAVEALAGELWPDARSAAVAESDNRKGERVVLATEHKSATRADFIAFAKGKGAADLMIPAEVINVESIPVLGSGKLDFAAINKMVRERPRFVVPTPRTPNGLGRINGDGVKSA